MATAASVPMLDQNVSKFVSRTHKILINGKWVEAASGKTFPTYNPATGDVLSHVAEGDKEDINRAVKAARAAFETGPWSKITPSERGRMIWKLGDLIEKHLEEFAQLESLDNGKPLTVARVADVPLAADHFRYMAGWATKIEGNTIPISSGGGKTQFLAYTLREPIGVVGQIIPWNFPLLMAAWKLGPALATGCTVVLKPAEQTPLTALLLGELIQEAGIPDGVVNIVPGYGETAGAALAAHPDVDKVAFTGSTEVGKLILQAAAGNLKKVSLELGGKSPNIVLEDADLDAAIRRSRQRHFLQPRPVLLRGLAPLRRKRYFRQSCGRRRETCKQHSRRSRNGSLERHGASRFRRATEPSLRLSRIGNLGRRKGSHRRIARGDKGYFVKPTVLVNTNEKMKVVQRRNFRARGHRDSLPQHRGNRREGKQLDLRSGGRHLDSRHQEAHGSRACSAPEPCGSTATTCLTPRSPSADTSSPAGAAKWATKSSSSTPRSRPSAPRFRNGTRKQQEI